MRANHFLIVLALCLGVLPAQGTHASFPHLEASPVWEPCEIAIPTAATAVGGLGETTLSPANPWLDFRMHAWLVAPSGRVIGVPGFYAADGHGGDRGSTWKIRWTPDETGIWGLALHFEQGRRINVRDPAIPGTPVFPHGQMLWLWVGPRSSAAKGFHRRGPLEVVGARYLRHRDGTWFLKTGTNSPENLLYAGFDGARDLGGLPRSSNFLHTYAAHVRDWRPGDPDWRAGGNANAGRGIIGALNYLASRGVNSIYFLPLNLGGDGQDTFPFVDPTGNSFDQVTHYDVGRLEQWNAVLTHAQRLGMLLEFVLAEEENPNINWLGPGLSDARRLFLKTMVAMFGHHPGIRWILCEENAPEPNDEFTVQELGAFAGWIQHWSSMRHPIGVHTAPDDQQIFEQILSANGPSAWLTSASLQVVSNFNPATEAAHDLFARHGRVAVVDIDEIGPAGTGVSVANQDDVRKLVLWDVLLSGGNVSWYAGYHPLPVGGDIRLEDFRTREAMWDYSRYARELLEELPYWRMEPADDLVTGETRHARYGDAEVLAAPGECYVVQFADATRTGTIDLITVAASTRFRGQWFDPLRGVFVGAPFTVRGGMATALPPAPAPASEDWVLVLTAQ